MVNVLRVPGDLWDILKQRLQPPQRVENMVVGLLGINHSEGLREFLLRDIHLPSGEDYVCQSPMFVQLRDQRVASLLERARDYSAFLLAHNHVGRAFFSSTDEEGIGELMRCYRHFRPGGWLLQMVWGTNGLLLRVANTMERRWQPVDLIKVIADEGFFLLRPLNSRLPENPAPLDVARHHRTLNYLGPRGEEVLRLLTEISVGVIGVGGNGAAVTYIAKFLGFRRWVLCDSDRVERHNSNRLFGYREGDDGKLKTEVVARELLAFDPTLSCLMVAEAFPAERAWEALKGCDLLLCCPDNDYCRSQATQFASRYLKVLIEMGAGIELDKKSGLPIRVGCQVRLQLPTAKGKCLVCNGLPTENLIPPEIEAEKIAQGRAVGYIKDSDLPTPTSVVTLNAMAAVLACRVLLSYLSGIGKTPDYLFYDDLGMHLVDLSGAYQKQPDCPICGRHSNSLFGWGDELPGHLQILTPEGGKANGF